MCLVLPLAAGPPVGYCTIEISCNCFVLYIGLSNGCYAGATSSSLPPPRPSRVYSPTSTLKLPSKAPSFSSAKTSSTAHLPACCASMSPLRSARFATTYQEDSPERTVAGGWETHGMKSAKFSVVELLVVALPTLTTATATDAASALPAVSLPAASSEAQYTN